MSQLCWLETSPGNPMVSWFQPNFRFARMNRFRFSWQSIRNIRNIIKIISFAALMPRDCAKCAKEFPNGPSFSHSSPHSPSSAPSSPSLAFQLTHLSCLVQMRQLTPPASPARWNKQLF